MVLLVWGTGRLVGKVVGKYVELDKISAFVDNNKNKKEYMGKRVLHPENVVQMEYDAILVANFFQVEIRKQCQSLGIDLKRVIFLYNNYTLEDVNKDYNFVEQILGKEYAEVVKHRYHVVRGVEAFGCPYLEDKGSGGGVFGK